MPGRVETTCVQDDLVPDEGVIIVRMWVGGCRCGSFRLPCEGGVHAGHGIGALDHCVRIHHRGHPEAVRTSLAGFVTAGPGGKGSADG